MEDSKPVGTPMCTGLMLTKDDDSKEVDQTLYRSMIGKLYYSESWAKKNQRMMLDLRKNAVKFHTAKISRFAY